MKPVVIINGIHFVGFITFGREGTFSGIYTVKLSRDNSQCATIALARLKMSSDCMVSVLGGDRKVCGA